MDRSAHAAQLSRWIHKMNPRPDWPNGAVAGPSQILIGTHSAVAEVVKEVVVVADEVTVVEEAVEVGVVGKHAV